MVGGVTACPLGALAASGVGADDPVERSTFVAAAVEATDKVSTVLMTERDGYVLG